MIFKHPAFLLLLLLLPILLWVWRRRRQEPTLAHPGIQGLTGLNRKARRVRWLERLPWLRLLALACCIVALARPQWGVQATRIDREGIAIAMVVDTSSSMSAQDLTLDDQRSNRLAVVKHTFNKFLQGDDDSLNGRDGDLVGLVTFARYSDTRSPLTLDHQALSRLLDDVTIVSLPEEDGTAIGDGMVMALDNLRRIKGASRVLILLTDGSNNAGRTTPMQAASIAKALGIKIYTIGAGTRGMALMPARKRGGGVEMRPTMVFIDDDGLTEVAEHTGGQYFRATDAQALDRIYSEIDALEKGRNISTSYQETIEVFGPLIILALLLLLIELSLRNTWLRTA